MYTIGPTNYGPPGIGEEADTGWGNTGQPQRAGPFSSFLNHWFCTNLFFFNFLYG